jgi:hypothetical protein
MMLPRRAVLLAGALLAGSSWFQASTPAMMTTTMTSDDWADWICAYTPPSFRHAVQASNHFLYREAVDNNGILQHTLHQICSSRKTFDDPAALEYFECLEQRLDQASVRARPSKNGHGVATSDPNEAGQWGPVVSVWPFWGPSSPMSGQETKRPCLCWTRAIRILVKRIVWSLTPTCQTL